MTEPTNPLFEDEKDFLERKKLEYERALRGDVEEIKENTLQAGKLALVGAGIAGGVWLLSRAFSSRKPKGKKHKAKKQRPAFEDYAGFDSFDENDQELTDLANDFPATDYDYDAHGNYAEGDQPNDGFAQAGAGYDDDEEYDQAQQSGFAAHAPYEADLDLAEDHDREEVPASKTSYQARPYDDSRRLPHSDSFAEDEPAHAAPTTPKRGIVGPALLAFAQSETGRVVIAQVAAVALALVTKTVQDFMPKDEAKTGKNADLAASSATVGVPPATWPATSAAQDAAAAAHHDDKLPHREPLA